MIFTQEQIDEIEQKLAKRGAKDTQLPSAKTPLTGDENIAIVQERENRLVPIGSIVNTDGGIFNVSEYLKAKTEADTSVILTLSEALEACPSRAKKAGQIITFLDKTKVWQQYQYQSNNITDWNNLLKWKNLNDINTKPIDDETAVIYNISDYIPGGSKYGRVIYPGVYTIYGTTTPVSQYRVIGGYDDSLGEVSFPLQLDETIVIKEIDDSVAIYDTYYLFAGNSIDGYGYQTTLYSGEDTIPDYIIRAFGDDSAYVLVNINRLENKINGKLDNKVDKIQGKDLSTNDFTNTNVSELANSVVNATYNSNTKKIVFTKNNSETIELDATPFIKDGMVNSVSISDGYLVITFNTDSGKETIRIPLTDVFNPDSYYTKTQTDGLLGNKVDKVQGKGLSTNDYTTAEKSKLNDLPTNSQLQLSLEGKANKIPMPPVIHELVISGTTQVSDVITLITGYFYPRTYTQIDSNYRNPAVIEFTVNYTGELRFKGRHENGGILKYIKAYVNGSLVETSTENITSATFKFDVEANDVVKVEFTRYVTDNFTGCIGDLSITSAGVPKDLVDVYNSLAPVATSGSYNDLSDTPTIPDITGKADKVSNATNGNFAALDSNGNLIDSGHKHSDYLTQHQDLSNYVQKSQTAGFVKNDGTIDTNTYITQHQDISGKANKNEMSVVPGTGANADKTTITLKQGTSATVLTAHQDITGKEDVTTIVTPVNATDETLPITTLTCEVGKYYRINVAVDTLAITLPAINSTTVKTVVIYLTSGTTPAVTISSADSKDVYYQDSFEIVAGNTYEINALFNGAAWIVAAVKINVE